MRKVLLTVAAAFTAGGIAAETLDFEAPAGFAEVSSSSVGAIRLREYRPIGQTVQVWEDGVTVFEWDDAGIGAAEFAKQVSGDLVAGCDAAFDLAPEVTEVDGRASALALYACPNFRISGRSEVAAIRVIEGLNGTLFAVQRAWVVRPPREELDEWMAWLQGIRVCPDAGCD